MFSISLWKLFELLQNLNKLTIKHLTKIILYENDVKLSKFRKNPVWVDFQYVWNMRFWLVIPELNTSRKANECLIYLSIINLMLACLLFKNFKTFNESCSLPKTARMSSTNLK